MNRAVGSGLEVKPPTDPEVYSPHQEDRYYSEIGSSKNPRFTQPNESNLSESHYMGNRGPNYPIFTQPDKTKDNRRPRAIWVLAVIGVVALAVALGAGLGVGLAGHNKSSSPT